MYKGRRSMRLIMIVGIASVLICSCEPVKKSGYIELGKLFENFSLKKELDNNLTRLKEARQTIMDSLQLELSVMSRQIESEKGKDREKVNLFSAKREMYLDRKHRYENEIDSLSHVYDAQVSTQINQYVKDFGIKNNYDFIFGADGSGTLMYASDSKNITEEIKKYLDSKYLGRMK